MHPTLLTQRDLFVPPVCPPVNIRHCLDAPSIAIPTRPCRSALQPPCSIATVHGRSLISENLPTPAIPAPLSALPVPGRSRKNTFLTERVLYGTLAHAKVARVHLTYCEAFRLQGIIPNAKTTRLLPGCLPPPSPPPPPLCSLTFLEPALISLLAPLLDFLPIRGWGYLMPPPCRRRPYRSRTSYGPARGFGCFEDQRRWRSNPVTRRASVYEMTMMTMMLTIFVCSVFSYNLAPPSINIPTNRDTRGNFFGLH